jgi:hypothetical protein
MTGLHKELINAEIVRSVARDWGLVHNFPFFDCELKYGYANNDVKSQIAPGVCDAF